MSSREGCGYDAFVAVAEPGHFLSPTWNPAPLGPIDPHHHVGARCQFIALFAQGWV